MSANSIASTTFFLRSSEPEWDEETDPPSSTLLEGLQMSTSS